jgi:hypothetical protein
LINIVCTGLSDSERLSANDVAKFTALTINQYEKNEKEHKGSEHDDNIPLAEWNEMFQEQADQLYAAVKITDTDQIIQEIFHCSAVLLEMMRHAIGKRGK